MDPTERTDSTEPADSAGLAEMRCGSRWQEPVSGISSSEYHQMMPYERLDAWKVCDELAGQVYRLTTSWPKAEFYGLTTQARRAALSAACNLAEGSAKHGRKEFARFVDISFGSLSELTYLLRFAKGLQYSAEDDFVSTEALCSRATQLTWRLLRSLRASA